MSMSTDYRCEDCQGPGADYLRDPYSYELYGEENMMWLCPDCMYDRHADV